MIFDGPKEHPNSCVKFTKFRDHELRQQAAYLRDTEELLQQEVVALGKGGALDKVNALIEKADADPTLKLFRRAIELLQTQKILIWMSHNVTGSHEERALRRRGFGSGEHERMSNEPFEWNGSEMQQLLKKFDLKRPLTRFKVKE